MNKFEIVYEEEDKILIGFALLDEGGLDMVGAEIMGELPYIYDVELEDGKVIMTSQIISISQAEEN